MRRLDLSVPELLRVDALCLEILKCLYDYSLVLFVGDSVPSVERGEDLCLRLARLYEVVDYGRMRGSPPSAP